jgi:endonuclease/exonuclease/phosphatase family metal-dependent hydrolase
MALAGSSCFPADYTPSEGDLAHGEYAPDPGDAPDSLVVGAYNIKFALETDQAILDIQNDEMLRRADLLLLQEMDPDSTEVLARTLGYDYVYYPGSLHPMSDRLFGNAIVSRWPILEQHFLLLANEGPLSGTQRIAVLGLVDVAGHEIWVASVHTATIVTPHDQRAEQNRQILQEANLLGGPFLVAGDFNTVTHQNRAELRDGFRRSGFRQARLPEGGTIRDSPWYSFGASPVLDHIFYRGFRLRRTGIALGALASDHYPIWAVFDFPPVVED